MNGHSFTRNVRCEKLISNIYLNLYVWLWVKLVKLFPNRIVCLSGTRIKKYNYNGKIWTDFHVYTLIHKTNQDTFESILPTLPIDYIVVYYMMIILWLYIENNGLWTNMRTVKGQKHFGLSFCSVFSHWSRGLNVQILLPFPVQFSWKEDVFLQGCIQQPWFLSSKGDATIFSTQNKNKFSKVVILFQLKCRNHTSVEL